MRNRVEDITCHPKRTQADNVRLAGTSFYQIVRENSGIPAPDEAPMSYTLESVIDFYNRNSNEGPLAKMYEFTAFCLEKYRQFLMQSIRAEEAEEAAEPEYDDTESEEDGSDSE